MKVSDAKKKYRNQWILAEVLKEDPKTQEPQDVKVVAHSTSRNVTYKAMDKMRGKYIMHFYNGPIPKRGYALAL